MDISDILWADPKCDACMKGGCKGHLRKDNAYVEVADVDLLSGVEDFRSELQSLINRNSKENGSNTPDFILAEFLNSCLAAFDAGVNARQKWYGISSVPGGVTDPNGAAVPFDTQEEKD